MRTETNENCGLDDRNSLINRGNQSYLPEKDTDDDTEKEVNTPSQPAEEHLITEAVELKENEPLSDYEEPDQSPEEIDPVNHLGDFQRDIYVEKPKRPLVD